MNIRDFVDQYEKQLERIGITINHHTINNPCINIEDSFDLMVSVQLFGPENSRIQFLHRDRTGRYFRGCSSPVDILFSTKGFKDMMDGQGNIYIQGFILPLLSLGFSKMFIISAMSMFIISAYARNIYDILSAYIEYSISKNFAYDLTVLLNIDWESVVGEFNSYNLSIGYGNRLYLSSTDMLVLSSSYNISKDYTLYEYITCMIDHWINQSIECGSTECYMILLNWKNKNCTFENHDLIL